MKVKLCSYPCCTRYAVEGTTRCERHQLPKKEFPKTGWLSDDERRFYNSQRWRTLRAEALRSNPVCQMCGKAQASEVHHNYRPGYDFHNDEDFYNPDALVCLCRECHQKITRESMSKR